MFLGVSSVSKTLLGERIHVPIEIGALRPLLFNPLYSAYCPEQDILRLFLGRLQLTDLVYDVGAFVGIHTLLSSRVARSVVAIEPNPTMFKTLQRTVQDNQATNITSVQVAIGSRTGAAELFFHGSASSLRPNRDSSGHHTSVELTTLDDLAKANGETPDAIKIDVEGAELEVLRGANRCLAASRVIWVEVHSTKLPLFDSRPDEIWKMLGDHGYEETCQYQAFRGGQRDDERVHVIFEKRASF